MTPDEAMSTTPFLKLTILFVITLKLLLRLFFIDFFKNALLSLNEELLSESSLPPSLYASMVTTACSK